MQKSNTNFNDVLIVALIVLTAISVVAAAIYLVMHEHPWFAIFLLFGLASARIKWGGKEKEGYFDD